MSNNQTDPLPTYVISRHFNAPVETVWKAWTEPELITQWYGPNVDTIIHQFELKPGGIWLNEMRMNTFSDRSRSVFMEVSPNKRLVWHQSSADEDWNVTANPMMPDWPTTVATEVTFESDQDQTDVSLVWSPYQASDAQIACFAEAAANFGSGWEAGFTIMDDLLKSE